MGNRNGYIISDTFVHKICPFQQKLCSLGGVFAMSLMARGADSTEAVRELREDKYTDTWTPEKLASGGLGSLMEKL